jgi:outer membrane protein OmpA-like peptidoglycan-associated protein
MHTRHTPHQKPFARAPRAASPLPPLTRGEKTQSGFGGILWSKIVLPATLLTLFLANGSASCLQAQQNSTNTSRTVEKPLQLPRWMFGVVAHGGVNFHVANFRALPNVPSSSPGYTSGTGTGFAFGVLAEMPIGAIISSIAADRSNAFALSFRAGYAMHDGLLRASESLPISIDGNRIDATINHTLRGRFGSVGAEILARWRPFAAKTLNGANDDFNDFSNFSTTNFFSASRFSVYAGVRASAMIRANFDQDETLVEPTGLARFSDGAGGLSLSRNTVVRRDFSSSAGMSGTPSIAQPFVSIQGGFAYDIPLNTAQTLILAPEIFFSLAATPFIAGVNWTAHSLRGGLSVKFAPERLLTPEQANPSTTLNAAPIQAPTAQTLPEQAVAEQAPPQKTRTKKLRGSIAAFAVSEDANSASTTEEPLLRLRVEEFIARQLYPVLHYVFFDRKSAVIPARYKRLFTGETRFFNEKNFTQSDLLTVYYNMLNIIGKRMQTNSNATITLTGCLGEIGFGPDSEENEPTLARRRAESVRQYLRDVWKIDTARVSIVARAAVPERFSNSKNAAANTEENRRVEITSNDWNIMKPVVVGDTVRLSSASNVKVRLNAETESGIAKWLVKASQGAQTLKLFSALGAPDSAFTWNISREQASMPRSGDSLRFALELLDNDEQEETAVAMLPVELVTVQKKRSERRGDKELDVYRFIGFEFERSGITDDHERLLNEFVRPYLKAESRLEATGYTDNITGDAGVNLRLSEQRAQTLVNALSLGSKTARGVGGSKLLYPNNLPEGRFYSRTVELRVETPVR